MARQVLAFTPVRYNALDNPPPPMIGLTVSHTPSGIDDLYPTQPSFLSPDLRPGNLRFCT